MRLFLGLRIPPELAQALTRLTRAIEPPGPLDRTRNIHLTMVFLAEVAAPTLPLIKRELSGLSC